MRIEWPPNSPNFLGQKKRNFWNFFCKYNWVTTWFSSYFRTIARFSSLPKKKNFDFFFFVKENRVTTPFSCSFRKRKIGQPHDSHVLLKRKKIKWPPNFPLRSITKLWIFLKKIYIILLFFIIFCNIVDHEMNIWFCLIFLVWIWKKHWSMQRIGKRLTSLNVSWALDNLLCNWRRRVQIVSSTTFVKILQCYAFNYRSPFDVVVAFLINNIVHWPSLYASSNWS